VDYRCLIGNCSCKTVRVKNLREQTTYLSVNATATFFETMVGGVADAGLPADTSKKK
jgi:hypothetical protein